MPFHFNSTLLGTGSIILPGNWGRIVVTAGPAHSLFEREQRFEHHRLTKHRDAPLRLTSSFYFERLSDALLYGQKDFGWRVMMLLYEVELMDPHLPAHRGNHELVVAQPSQQQIEDYWTGMPVPEVTDPPVPMETISGTRLRVLHRVALPPPA